MAEQALIVAELKRALREHELTYTDVARKLELSVATVKRLFSTGDFSLQRVDGICELMGISLREILERGQDRATPVNQLTVTQECEIVADPPLFFVTWLVLNRTPFEEITRSYRFTERELLACFIRLDRLKVIELQPGNRVRLLVSRRFSWRAGGPVQRYLHERLLREFLASTFTAAQEEFVFHGARMSREVLAQLKRVQQNAARECMELIEQDRSAPEGRIGAAFVLALRPWSYTGFAQFERRS
jgi:AcrR family transcriptional regulator